MFWELFLKSLLVVYIFVAAGQIVYSLIMRNKKDYDYDAELDQKKEV